MAKITREYTVFLSGPSDVSSDIALVRQVIEDVNILMYHSDVRFVCRHWIDDVTPGAGAEPQDRINSQLTDYDVIVR